jgi:hypothetical protein
MSIKLFGKVTEALGVVPEDLRFRLLEIHYEKSMK